MHLSIARSSARRTASSGSARLATFSLAILQVALVVAGCGGVGASPQPSPATVTFTDDAGRQVQLPETIDSAFATNPLGTITIYTLAPDKMAGWSYGLSETEKLFVPTIYQQLPNLGGWYGKTVVGNVEEILKRDPDVIIDMGDVDSLTISEADRIQTELGKPVILLDGDLNKLEHAYSVLGQILGEQQRAAQLGAYCRQTIDEISKLAKTIPSDGRVSVFYAEGLEGLETDPEGSDHSLLLTLAGAANVANVALADGYGRTPVSLEQVTAWNPGLIIVGSNPGAETDSYRTIRTSPQWSAIDAVKTGEVYEAPHGPFDWFDRPPSVGRVLGLEWVANLLYPDIFTYDIRGRTRDFYALFYHLELSDQQLDWLLHRAARGVDGLTPRPALSPVASPAVSGSPGAASPGAASPGEEAGANDLQLKGKTVATVQYDSFPTTDSWTGSIKGGPSAKYEGEALYKLVGMVDDDDPNTFSEELAEQGYTILLRASDGYTVQVSSKIIAGKSDWIVAKLKDGAPLPTTGDKPEGPYRYVGSFIADSPDGPRGSVGMLASIELKF